MGFKLTPYTVRHAEYADVAGKLAFPQPINGINFDGTAPVDSHGSVATDAASQHKKVTISGYKLVPGALLQITFPTGNSASSPTLNISGTGDKPILYSGQPLLPDAIKSGHTYQIMYDGKNYQITGDYSDTPEVRKLINDAKTEAENKEQADNKATNKRIDDLTTKEANDVKSINTNITNLSNKEASDNKATNKRIDDLTTKEANDVKSINTNITNLSNKEASDNKAVNKRIDDLTSKEASDIKSVNSSISALTTKENTDISAINNMTNLKTPLNVAVLKNKQNIETDNKALNKRIDDLKLQEGNDIKAINDMSNPKTVLNIAVNKNKTDIANDNKALNKRIDDLTTKTANDLKNAQNTLNTNITTALNIVTVNKSGNFNIDATMMNKLLVITGASTITVPKLGPNGFHVYIKNIYNNNITIKPSGCTIDRSGNAFTLSSTMSILLLSDGTNYTMFDTSAKFQ